MRVTRHLALIVVRAVKDAKLIALFDEYGKANVSLVTISLD